MSKFTTVSPKVEIIGDAVVSVVAGMGAFRETALKILGDCGIQNPTPEQWYKQQAWLDALRLIGETIGPKTLQMIGRSVPNTAKFPPGIDSMEKALGSIDIAYHMNHRGPLSGNYKMSKVSDTKIIVVCDSAYPCDFDFGIVSAMAERFRPAAAVVVKVSHDPTSPCRKTGGAPCTYVVSW